MADAPGSIEPAITRLQLELNIRRRAAEACIRAGFRSGAEVAAADDRDFHARVRLSEEERADVLARARAPGSIAVEAGPRPVLASERLPTQKVLAVAKPVADRIVRMAGEAERAPAPRGAAKADPPQGEAEGRRKRRKEADDLEAELDRQLRDSV